MTLVALKYADDLSLARAAAAGNRQAQKTLMDRLLDRVRTTVRYATADDRDQDDFIQLSLLEILASVAGYKAESSIETWADRITIRTAMRHLKQRRRREAVVRLDPDALPGHDQELGDDQTAILTRRRLARLLGRLSPEKRMVVVLRLVHGYSLEEISDMTDTPVNTVRDRLQVGRRKLRDAIVRDPVLGQWAWQGKA